MTFREGLPILEEDWGAKAEPSLGVCEEDDGTGKGAVRNPQILFREKKSTILSSLPISPLHLFPLWVLSCLFFLLSLSSSLALGWVIPTPSLDPHLSTREPGCGSPMAPVCLSVLYLGLQGLAETWADPGTLHIPSGTIKDLTSHMASLSPAWILQILCGRQILPEEQHDLVSDGL